MPLFKLNILVLLRLLQVREMQLLDVARRKMLHQQHLLKEAELHRLDDEIRKKVDDISSFENRKIFTCFFQAEERKDVLDSGIKSAELKALELETQTKILENVKFRFF